MKKSSIWDVWHWLFWPVPAKEPADRHRRQKIHVSTTDSRWIWGNHRLAIHLIRADTTLRSCLDTTISGRVYRILKHGNGAQDYYFNSGNDYRFQKANGGAGLDPDHLKNYT